LPIVAAEVETLNRCLIARVNLAANGYLCAEARPLIFIANNLPPLPLQKTYELWLIPEQGAPIPAGPFKPKAHGSATVINPPLPPDTIAKTFAMTVEDDAGATSPTTPIAMRSAGE
jgi:hypothetical protein